jgi:hypothetical protein
MIAHDSAGAHVSLIPALLVFLPRCPPGRPSPRLSAGPRLGRGGAIDDGGWRSCPRNAPVAFHGPPAAALASGLDAHHAACPAHRIGGR